MKLNLGSGKRNRDGFINIDAIKQTEDTVVANILSLTYDDNSIDHIYSSHVIEHLDKNEIKVYFKECSRMLKSGGIMEILAPCMTTVIDNYKNGKCTIDFLDDFLFARHLHEYDYHKQGIYEQKLKKLYTEYGFTITRIDYNDNAFSETEIHVIGQKK